MKTGYKYFIEHKTLHTWLVVDGTLTNNPNEPGIMSWDEGWLAEEYLKPLQPRVTSDFTGQVSRTDYSGVNIWLALKDQIAEKNNGADLYSDFIITEHEFVSPD